MSAPRGKPPLSTRIRTLTWWGGALLVAGLALSLPAVDPDVESRGSWIEVVLRLLFVPIGQVIHPHLLWTSRGLIAAAVVVWLIGNHGRRRINRSREGGPSGNPAVRARAAKARAARTRQRRR